MEILLSSRTGPRDEATGAEMVERKGLGHPDTICDALAEELCVALCAFYRNAFGHILHHNVDKALLWAGSSRPRFGGGEILEPFEIYLAGRAVLRADGIEVPIEDLAERVTHDWLRANLRYVEPREHVRVRPLVRPGSVDLVRVFEDRRAHEVLANDTSCGVGHAPYTRLERAVLAAEGALTAMTTRRELPFLGEDVKVMGVRRGGRFEFTVACAFVDRFVRGPADYREHRRVVEEYVRRAVLEEGIEDASVTVNAADRPERGEAYLTVLGTSAESGDDGAAGRGNRVGGLITPSRPMSLEAAAGKNPLSHVGKIYNVLAPRIAADVVAEIDEIEAADCWMVSRIGQPVREPWVVQLALHTRDAADPERFRASVEAIVRRHLYSVDEFWRGFANREFPLV